MNRRAARAVVGVVVVAAGAAALACAALAPRPKARAEVTAGLPALVMLAPGTRVDGPLGGGWSERVIRSVPRLASGEVATLPGFAKASATLLRTTIVAQVAGTPGRHRLQTVGLGNAVPFGRGEVVVTPDGPDEVRATLSSLQGYVADTAYEELARGRLAARTPTFALVRMPAKLAAGGGHREVDMLFAVLADLRTGAVRTLHGASPSGQASAPPSLVLLPRDLTYDCGLDVAVSRRVGPINVSWSFAMAALPEGRPVALSRDLAFGLAEALAGRGDPAALEAALRALLPPAENP